jgi:hypothetical protein
MKEVYSFYVLDVKLYFRGLLVDKLPLSNTSVWRGLKGSTWQGRRLRPAIKKWEKDLWARVRNVVRCP